MATEHGDPMSAPVEKRCPPAGDNLCSPNVEIEMTVDNAELHRGAKGTAGTSWVSNSVRRAPQNRDGMRGGGMLERRPEEEGSPPAPSIVPGVAGPGRQAAALLGGPSRERVPPPNNGQLDRPGR